MLEDLMPPMADSDDEYADEEEYDEEDGEGKEDAGDDSTTTTDESKPVFATHNPNRRHNARFHETEDEESSEQLASSDAK